METQPAFLFKCFTQSHKPYLWHEQTHEHTDDSMGIFGCTSLLSIRGTTKYTLKGIYRDVKGYIYISIHTYIPTYIYMYMYMYVYIYEYVMGMVWE